MPPTRHPSEGSDLVRQAARFAEGDPSFRWDDGEGIVNPAATFFVAVLSTQLGFTGPLVGLVARRFPRRLPLYRFVAPAAVPLLLFCSMVVAFLSVHPDNDPVAIFRLFLAYAVLWLVGIVWASMIARWSRR